MNSATKSAAHTHTLTHTLTYTEERGTKTGTQKCGLSGEQRPRQLQHLAIAGAFAKFCV